MAAWKENRLASHPARTPAGAPAAAPPLQILNLDSCPALARLDVSKNQLASLEGVSLNRRLKWLSAAANSVASLDALRDLDALEASGWCWCGGWLGGWGGGWVGLGGWVGAACAAGCTGGKWGGRRLLGVLAGEGHGSHSTAGMGLASSWVSRSSRITTSTQNTLCTQRIGGGLSAVRLCAGAERGAQRVGWQGGGGAAAVA